MNIIPSRNKTENILKNSVLYKEFLAEREEILRHKWIESEKLGYDIGFERALLDWVFKHRSEWRAQRRQKGRLSESSDILTTTREEQGVEENQ